MSCVNHQMHQTIVLLQTESDDEEIDVTTVDVNDEKLSQELEFASLNQIEFQIDSDSDEFVDVVTVSPIRQINSKIQGNKKITATSKSHLTASHATVNNISKNKMNNHLEDQCFTKKTSKRKLDRLGNTDLDDNILKKYTSKRRNVNIRKTGETSMFRKVLSKNDKVSSDKTDFGRKRGKRKETKNEQTSKALIDKTVSATGGLKLKASVKIILPKVDVNSYGVIKDKKSARKTLKTSTRSALKTTTSALVASKKSKRKYTRQINSGKKTTAEKGAGQTVLKAKRKYTRKCDKQNG